MSRSRDKRIAIMKEADLRAEIERLEELLKYQFFNHINGDNPRLWSSHVVQYVRLSANLAPRLIEALRASEERVRELEGAARGCQKTLSAVWDEIKAGNIPRDGLIHDMTAEMLGFLFEALGDEEGHHD